MDGKKRNARSVGQKNPKPFPEHKGVAPMVFEVMMTIPAVEAFQAAGSTVEPLDAPKIGYRLTLGDKMPTGIIAVHLNESPWTALRLDIEPEYPNEFEDYWAQVQFTPCPVCGAPVIWYEAGFVPGYRVCAKKPHHHSLAK